MKNEKLKNTIETKRIIPVIKFPLTEQSHRACFTDLNQISKMNIFEFISTTFIAVFRGSWSNSENWLNFQLNYIAKQYREFRLCLGRFLSVQN
jgi:hypothetical protein